MDVASSWDALCAVNGTGMFTPKFQDSRISVTCLVEIYYGMHRRAHECTLEIDLWAKACRPARPSCPDATDRCAKSRCNSVRTYIYIYICSIIHTSSTTCSFTPLVTFSDFPTISIITWLRSFMQIRTFGERNKRNWGSYEDSFDSLKCQPSTVLERFDRFLYVTLRINAWISAVIPYFTSRCAVNLLHNFY